MRAGYKIAGVLMLVFLLDAVTALAQSKWEAASRQATLNSEWHAVAEKAREWKRHEPGEVVANWLIG